MRLPRRPRLTDGIELPIKDDELGILEDQQLERPPNKKERRTADRRQDKILDKVMGGLQDEEARMMKHINRSNEDLETLESAGLFKEVEELLGEVDQFNIHEFGDCVVELINRLEGNHEVRDAVLRYVLHRIYNTGVISESMRLTGSMLG